MTKQTDIVMRPGTLRAICNELMRARKKYPDNKNLCSSLEVFHLRLRNAMVKHRYGNADATAADIYEKAIIVVALAIRVLEEGDAEFPYRSEQATGQNTFDWQLSGPIDLKHKP